MNSLHVPAALLDTIGWVLVNSVWQLLLIALLALVLDRVMRRRSGRARYAMFVAAMAAMTAAPVATLLTLPGSDPVAAIPDSAPVVDLMSVPIPHNFTFGERIAVEPIPAVDTEQSATPHPHTRRWSIAGVWSSCEPILQASLPTIDGLWLLGVCLFAWRPVLSWREIGRLRRVGTSAADDRMEAAVSDLARRMGLSRAVRILQSTRVRVPVVVGCFRPVILLPVSLIGQLPVAQLEAILAHELAHVRRYDYLVNVWQTLVETVLFYHPAVWWLSRRIRLERENCCDDIAVAVTRDPVEFSHALLAVAQLRGAQTALALGVRGGSLLARVARLFPSERPRRPLGAGSLLVLGVLATSLASLAIWATAIAKPLDENRSPSAAKTAPAPDKAAPATEANDRELAADADVGERSFELSVVGPDGKPVPEALVRLHTDPAPTGKEILEGKFVSGDSYVTMATASAEGRLVVRLLGTPKWFDVYIKTPGYGPYWGDWSGENDSIPRRVVARLTAGWSMGGIIVDSDGKPVEDVKICPTVQYRTRTGTLEESPSQTDRNTDKAGKWRFDSVPVSMNEVFVEISHPDFEPLRRTLTRSEFEIATADEPGGKIVLSRGQSVVGSVTDEAGNPIAGALVQTQFLNAIREAKTNDAGRYELIGCEPRTAMIVASAKGRAIDMKDMRIEPGMEPVNFQLKPGGRVRIRVLDEHDQPVPEARIFFQRWRDAFAYFPFAKVNQFADKHGVWEWHEAPLDGFTADISGSDQMELISQPLIVRAEEYVFHLSPPLVVSGKVIDAETRQPVQSFRVIPGIRGSDPKTDRDSHIDWARSLELLATGGEYQERQTRGYFAHLVRIEADGYQPAVSRDIRSGEGNVTIDFELTKGKDVAATVLAPDGKPAAGARLALGAAGSQIDLKNGEIAAGATYAAQIEADEAGKFRFPPQDGAFQLVVVHPAGYAHVKATPAEAIPNTIELTAWARVEGTFQIGKAPQANVPITILAEGIYSNGPGLPSIFTTNDVTTEKEGRFVFKRVVAGRARIGRRIIMTVNDGAEEMTSAQMVGADFRPGKTSRVVLGGTGRAVVGKLQQPDLTAKVNWSFATIDVERPVPPPPYPTELVPAEIRDQAEKEAEWFRKWKQTEAGKAWTARLDAYEKNQDSGPRFTASVGPGGAFRIDDMPAGDYSLSAQFSVTVGRRGGRIRDYRFTVPAFERSAPAEPLDLGVLTLE